MRDNEPATLPPLDPNTKDHAWLTRLLASYREVPDYELPDDEIGENDSWKLCNPPLKRSVSVGVRVQYCDQEGTVLTLDDEWATVQFDGLEPERISAETLTVVGENIPPLKSRMNPRLLRICRKVARELEQAGILRRTSQRGRQRGSGRVDHWSNEKFYEKSMRFWDEYFELGGKKAGVHEPDRAQLANECQGLTTRRLHDVLQSRGLSFPKVNDEGRRRAEAGRRQHNKIRLVK